MEATIKIMRRPSSLFLQLPSKMLTFALSLCFLNFEVCPLLFGAVLAALAHRPNTGFSCLRCNVQKGHLRALVVS